MMHRYHEDLPGYDARQILHDGCPECEHRGADIELALAHMDRPTFIRAWRRAQEFNKSSSGLGISRAEAPVLRVLGSIQLRVADMVNSGTSIAGM